MILLDTHVLVWLLNDNPRLGMSARETIKREEGAVLLSAMTFWELAILTNKHRVTLPAPLVQVLDMVADVHRMAIVPVSAEIAIDANRLPRLHGDPVDRLLMATARNLNCGMMTADHVIEDYAAAGHLQAIDARH